jgi:catechol 2,3-dioxygenase-like lactoylglutathione lyase family enzyme
MSRDGKQRGCALGKEIKMEQADNSKFEITGIHHIALVCSDMDRTIEFYRDILGLPLVETLTLPNGKGYHFFFQLGNGEHVAFFWYAGAPGAAPGISTPACLPRRGDSRSAHGSMNHIAFTVPLEKFDEYVERIKIAGIEFSIIEHDDSPSQIADKYHEGVWSRSVYFFDPDQICLEFSVWTKPFGALETAHGTASGDVARASSEAVHA